MKPLLVFPPAPQRWPALSHLLGHKGPRWLEDIEKRLCTPPPGSRDVFAVIPNGGEFLANACINASGDVGVLGHVFTRGDHRRRGLAKKIMQAAVAWFDMSGGKWLYLGCHAELAPVYQSLGFQELHRHQSGPVEDITMLRKAAGVPKTPLPDGDGEVQMRGVTRADWPLIVALLQDRPGADPRVSLAESAVTAELTGLELISQQEDGKCHLIAATRADRIIALASLAIAQPGGKTFATHWPHDGPPPALRAAVQREAAARNYERVEFPMEALAGEGNG